MYDKYSKGKNIDEKIHLSISAASAISIIPTAIISGGAAAVIPAANTLIGLYNANISRESSKFYKNGKDICDEFLNGTLETNVVKVNNNKIISAIDLKNKQATHIVK